MKLKTILSGTTLAMALAATLGVVNANAQINSPVPSSATINFEGKVWAWGGPCPFSGGCFATGDLSYQGTQGWAPPTAAEMATVDAYDAVDPSALADLFLNNPAGNVPAGGSDPVSGATFFGANSVAASCASPYFATLGTYWCDAGDGQDGDWAGSVRSDGYYAEQLYVKGGVPEASTWALMLIGFGGLGAVMRSRRKLSGADAA